MKISNFVKLLMVVCIIGFVAQQADAQKTDKVPYESFALGVAVGGVGGVGGAMNYAINENVHVGGYLGFYYDSGRDDDSETFLYFSPYGKFFIMEPIRNLRPFILAQFVVSTLSAEITNVFGSTTVTETSTGIIGSIGAEWFPYTSIGVYGGFNVISLYLDPVQFQGGLGHAFLGVEFYVD